jgi:DNA-binding GntR family transcriptional regulator
MAHALFHSQLPLWYQVAQSLRAEILSSPHTEPLRIPTEVELALKYSVSVITIRQSLKYLQQEGLIYRQRRHGTFAHPNTVKPNSLKLLGLAESIIAQYASEPTEVLSRRLESPPAQVAALFPDVASVVTFHRRSKVNNEVTSYLVNYLDPNVGELISENMAAGSITKAIRDVGKADIGSFHNSVSAVLPTPMIAEQLGVDLVSPVLFFEGVCFDRNKRVLDVAHIYYRADRYKFSVDFEIPQ